MFKHSWSDRIFRLVSAIALVIVTASPAMAQANSTQNTIGAIGNLFGALAQAGAKAKAQKGWAQIDPQITQCVNTMFSSKNVTVDQIIAAGLAPNDQRIFPVINACNVVLSTELKRNFPCTTPNSKGVQVATMCSEVYARDESGGFTQLSREQFLVAAGSGEKVQVATLETSEANAARLAAERQQEAAERQRYLNSPEVKRQAALEAAQARQAEAQQRRTAAAEAAREAIRPRGYMMICLGDNGGGVGYNKLRINCESPDGVLISLAEAIKLMENKGGVRYQIDECKGAIIRARKWYAALHSYANSKEYIDICNAGLQQLKGPSAIQASGKSR